MAPIEDKSEIPYTFTAVNCTGAQAPRVWFPFNSRPRAVAIRPILVRVPFLNILRISVTRRCNCYGRKRRYDERERDCVAGFHLDINFQ